MPSQATVLLPLVELLCAASLCAAFAPAPASNLPTHSASVSFSRAASPLLACPLAGPLLVCRCLRACVCVAALLVGGSVSAHHVFCSLWPSPAVLLLPSAAAPDFELLSPPLLAAAATPCCCRIYTLLPQLYAVAASTATTVASCC